MRIDVTDPAGDRWEFDWDPVSGEVSGPDGWWVDHLLKTWDGFATCSPVDPPVPSPRKSAPGMALFLMAQGFRPPDALQSHLAHGTLSQQIQPLQ